MVKRIFYIMLILTVLLQITCAIALKTEAVTYLSTEEVTAKLNGWKSKLDNKYWNYYDRSKWDSQRSTVEANLKAIVDNGILEKTNATNTELGVTTSACTGDYFESGCRSNYFSGGWQCYGFAWWLEYALFQSTYQFNPSEWYVYSGNSLNGISLQPGDLVRVSNHSIVVSDVSGGALKCVEAWGGSGCKIRWSPGFNWSEYTTASSMLNAAKSKGGTVYRYKYVGITPQQTLSFNTNGGSSISSITAQAGATVTIPSTVPTRLGWNFIAWYNGSTRYMPGDSITLSSDVTLAAQWNCGTISYTEPMQKDTKITFPGIGVYYSLQVPTTAMYEFKGYSGNAMDTVFRLYNDNYDLLASDDDSAGNLQFRLEHFLEEGRTYYAYIAPYGSTTTGTMYWDIRQGYDVWCMDSFGNDGIYSGCTMGDCYPGISDPTLYDTEITTRIPEKSGYTFAGWSTTPNSWVAMYQPGQQVTVQFQSGRTPADGVDLRLYPVWSNSENVTGISVTTNKTEYAIGEELDWEKLTLTWYFSDGTSYSGEPWDMGGSVSISDYDNGTSGTKTITFCYDEKFSATFEIEIINGGKCGDNLTWQVDENNVLTISGTGSMYDYVLSGPWNKSIVKLVVGEGVTTIGDYAFYSCDQLREVSLPNSLCCIGTYAFCACRELETINIPEGVNTIESYAFGWSGLKRIGIPNSAIYVDSDIIEDCHLTDIYYAGSTVAFDTLKITNPSNATVHYRTAAINMSQFPESDHNYGNNENDTQVYSWPGAESITVTFSAQTETESNYDYIYLLDAPGNQIGKYSGTTAAGLTVTVPGDTVQVKLTSDVSVQKYGYSFDAILIKLPNQVNGTCGENLTWTLDGEGVLYISGKGPMMNYFIYGAPWYEYNLQVQTVVIENGVTTIGEYAFCACESLVNATIPNTVTSIGKLAFQWCPALVEITIPDSVTSIGSSAFQDCTSLRNVTISDSVTVIDRRAFYNCSSLSDVYYIGTQAQWDKISIGSMNTNLTEAILHIQPIVVEAVIATLPNKLVYQIGEELDVLGLSLLVTYKDGSTETVSAGFTISGFSSTTVGTKTITVAYQGKTATFKISVIEVDVIDDDGTGYATLKEAVVLAKEGATLILLDDAAGNVTIDKTINIDLNGYDIQGTVTVAEVCILYCFDSQTDDYTIKDEAGYGKITKVVGNVQGLPVESTAAEDCYLMVTEADGVSFHRVNLQMTAMTLRSSEAGVYYKSTFAGDELVEKNVSRFGVALSVKGMPTVENLENHCILSWFEGFEAGINGDNKNSTLLHGILKSKNSNALNAQNAAMPIYGRPYILTSDGQYLFGATVSRSLQEQVEAVDAMWSQLNAEQQAEMTTMYQTYADVMQNWALPNLQAALAPQSVLTIGKEEKIA